MDPDIEDTSPLKEGFSTLQNDSIPDPSFFPSINTRNVRWRVKWLEERIKQIETLQQTGLLLSESPDISDSFTVLQSSRDTPQYSILRYSLSHPLFTINGLTYSCLSYLHLRSLFSLYRPSSDHFPAFSVVTPFRNLKYY